ncbi:MAG TPA: serine hydrolase [Vicinamibacteria bacterium]|nr:serine hydrolase [Vicinamibacteria bacterium]
MKRVAAWALACALAFPLAAAPQGVSSPEGRIARARSLELDTRYEPPPGDPLAHHAAGCAKVMCSAVFVTGLELGFAWENVGYFTCPLEERGKLGRPVVEKDGNAVRVALPGGGVRRAVYVGDQGCVALPVGRDAPFFEPVRVASALPDAAKTPWPMGDVPPEAPLPGKLDAATLERATDAAFDPAAMTAAFVVTWQGRIVAERYGPGIAPHTALESWSMGKSLTATLMGVLIRQGAYSLDQRAPIPQWQSPGDPRSRIRIADLLTMSSGLRIRAPLDPDFDPALGYPDHLYLYTGTVDSFEYAATRPPQWPAGTVGRYRNTDPVLVNSLIRRAVERRGEEYLSFPRRALFDRIGIRTMVMETDPYGNFLTQGYELASARDWARLGNLYLKDGVWDRERILPEGFVKFVSSVAPAWQADGRPVYGGFFWINGEREFPVPESAYYMSGAGGQTTLIVPTHDLVVVRLGHFRGAAAADDALNRALALLMQAVPSSR